MVFLSGFPTVFPAGLTFAGGRLVSDALETGGEGSEGREGGGDGGLQPARLAHQLRHQRLYCLHPVLFST